MREEGRVGVESKKGKGEEEGSDPSSSQIRFLISKFFSRA